ncbi:MAG: DUF1698 domain-containing protein [Pseudomonadota bacterium]
MLKITGEAHSIILDEISKAAHLDSVEERQAMADRIVAKMMSETEPQEAFAPVEKHKVDLDDSAFDRLNALLPWFSFFVDDKGRAAGNIYTNRKRHRPDGLNDPRIKNLVALADSPETLTAVEYGCFEGNHTSQLCDAFADVIAIDGRVENCIKTMARTWLLGHRPDVQLIDLEEIDKPLPEADVCHHVGVLYHLARPIEHLQKVLANTRSLALLDTQICAPGQENASIEINGKAYNVFRYKEPNISFAPFAGMVDFAYWLSEATIHELFVESGFSQVTHNLKEERNGQRLSVVYKRG